MMRQAETPPYDAHAGEDDAPRRPVLVETFEVADEAYAVVAFPLVDPALPESLTTAEREVARLVLEGLTNRQIGERRGTSERTVANQVRAVFLKCAVGNRAALAQAYGAPADDRPAPP